MRSFEEWLLQENFINKKHLEGEINSKLNSTLLKAVNPHNLHYVTLGDNKTGVEVYTKDLPPNIASKIVAAAKYYLTDMGVRIGPEHPNEHDPDIVDIPVISFPRYEQTPGQWDKVKNPEAKRRLEDGRAIDVADIGHEIDPGVWQLNKFIDGADYYDAKNDRWIWSISRDSQGRILAAGDTRFYNDDEYEPLWLR